MLQVALLHGIHNLVSHLQAVGAEVGARQGARRNTVKRQQPKGMQEGGRGGGPPGSSMHRSCSHAGYHYHSLSKAHPQHRVASEAGGHKLGLSLLGLPLEAGQLLRESKEEEEEDRVMAARGQGCAALRSATACQPALPPCSPHNRAARAQTVLPTPKALLPAHGHKHHTPAPS